MERLEIIALYQTPPLRYTSIRNVRYSCKYLYKYGVWRLKILLFEILNFFAPLFHFSNLRWREYARCTVDDLPGSRVRIRFSRFNMMFEFKMRSYNNRRPFKIIVLSKYMFTKKKSSTRANKNLDVLQKYTTIKIFYFV